MPPSGTSTISWRVRPGADVLDLAHDPVAGAVEVELGDLGAGVVDRERDLAGGRLGRADLAGVVGGARRRSGHRRPGPLRRLVAGGGAVLVQPASAAAAARTAVVIPARDLRDMVLLRSAGTGAGVVAARALRQQEQGEHDRDVGDPDDASSTVVCGEKLKMPLSRVPYQESGGIAALTSKASVFRPGRIAASCRSCTP